MNGLRLSGNVAERFRLVNYYNVPNSDWLVDAQERVYRPNCYFDSKMKIDPARLISVHPFVLSIQCTAMAALLNELVSSKFRDLFSILI